MHTRDLIHPRSGTSLWYNGQSTHNIEGLIDDAHRKHFGAGTRCDLNRNQSLSPCDFTQERKKISLSSSAYSPAKYLLQLPFVYPSEF